MTNRYKEARKSAECTWRFNGVAFGLRIQRLFAAALCRFGVQAFLPPCDQVRDAALPGRYLLKVLEKPGRTGPSSMHANIAGGVRGDELYTLATVIINALGLLHENHQ